MWVVQIDEQTLEEGMTASSGLGSLSILIYPFYAFNLVFLNEVILQGGKLSLLLLEFLWEIERSSNRTMGDNSVDERRTTYYRENIVSWWGMHTINSLRSFRCERRMSSCGCILICFTSFNLSGTNILLSIFYGRSLEKGIVEIKFLNTTIF